MDTRFTEIYNKHKDKIKQNVDLLYLFTNWYIQSRNFDLLIDDKKVKILDNLKMKSIDFPIKLVNDKDFVMLMMLSSDDDTFYAYFEGSNQNSKTVPIMLKAHLYKNNLVDIDGTISIVQQFDDAIEQIQKIE
ncbi:unnamed protein product [Rotaria socialis]|uniref:Uncharacterized protein n=1 Tax=Rotaria socialis TaxID=392032 RepID=A0A817Z0J3_9BILA|nr:unnamed protein product [Rotaria socialis]CAF3386971.1 unnamed protein product [Rotaria socialis]CAF4646688.1 unnamed protein product [Rotaria socialis]CAF4881379.1 unnamed protein product [Rotaria socialis]